MRCLCCNKVLSESATPYELSVCWHKKCIKSFFGTSLLPEVNISEQNLKQLAIDSTNKGYTVPGVQKKISLYLEESINPRLTLVNYPTGYILKPQTKEYKNLPEAEYLIMQMAKATGIKTVPFALINLSKQYVYITKRIDRIKQKGVVKMLAMEDFCQLEERLTQDKYKGSYERCAKILTRYSARPGFDLSELLLRLVFSFVVGNSDMHLKNFSLIETSEGSCEYVLSCAYDMLPVNIIIPKDNEQLALTINGKKRNIHKKDFLIYANSIDIPQIVVEKIIKNIVAKEEMYLSMCDESLLPPKMKIALKNLIKERIDTLKGNVNNI